MQKKNFIGLIIADFVFAIISIVFTIIHPEFKSLSGYFDQLVKGTSGGLLLGIYSASLIIFLGLSFIMMLKTGSLIKELRHYYAGYSYTSLFSVKDTIIAVICCIIAIIIAVILLDYIALLLIILLFVKFLL